jgi:hypothetical protein
MNRVNKIIKERVRRKLKVWRGNGRGGKKREVVYMRRLK